MEDLVFSARKKRKTLLEDGDEDESMLTPKKARMIHATPAKSIPGSSLKSPHSSRTIPTLAPELQHLLSIHTAIEQALSVSLATAQISPDADTGRVPSVITHVSIGERGLGVRMSVDDLKALCWIWEWDGSTLPKSVTESVAGKSATKSKGKARGHSGDENSDTEEIIIEDQDSNPFIVDAKPKLEEGDDTNPFLSSSMLSSSQPSKDWTRGGMGLVVSSAMHTTRLDKSSPTKRVPAYGIGIEVEWSQEDVVGGRVGGMAAVARWTAGGAKRKKDMKVKLEKWLGLTARYRGSKPFVPVPLANLPPLAKAPEVSKIAQLVGSTPRKLAFPSPFQTPKSRTPASVQTTPAEDPDGFKIPFPVSGDRPVTPHGPRPITPSSGSGTTITTPSSGRSSGIRTPSFGKAAEKMRAAAKEAATTPTTNGRVTPDRMDISLPNTPTTLRTPTTSMTTPSSSKTMPETPRRAALMERIRKKSESEEGSVKKTAVTATVRSSSKDQTNGKPIVEKTVLKMVGPEELRRRVILGRLTGIAESVWMLFSSSGSSGSMVTNASRKRRALERTEVVRAVVKSSKVPISEAEAIESLAMLCELCPFFLKTKVISGDDWLEMPASTGPTATPSSPGRQPSPSKLPPINFPTPKKTPPSTPPRSTVTLPGSPQRLIFPVGPPGSPQRRSVVGPPTSPTRRQIIEDELMNRSPKRIRKEEGGLRQVREIIRRELEVDEDDPFT